MKSFTHNRLPCRKIVPTLVGLLTMFFQQNIVGQTTLGSITSGTSPGCKMTFNVCSDDTIRLRPTDLVNYTNFKWYVTSVMPANEIDGAAVAAGNFNVLSSSSLPAILIRTPGTTQTLTFIITAERFIRVCHCMRPLPFLPTNYKEGWRLAAAGSALHRRRSDFWPIFIYRKHIAPIR